MDYPTPDGRYCSRCGSGFWVYHDMNPHQTVCNKCHQGDYEKRQLAAAKGKKTKEKNRKQLTKLEAENATLKRRLKVAKAGGDDAKAV